MSNQTLKMTKMQKARAIYDAGLVHRITEKAYEVGSQTDPHVKYGVYLPELFCECKDHDRTGKICKHIMACHIEKIECIKLGLTISQLEAIAKKMGMAGGGQVIAAK